MKHNLASTETLIRDLATRMISRPDELETGAQCDEHGTALIAMRCAPEDEGVLVGKGGCHVKAFAYLVERIGLARKKEYLFKLKTNGGCNETLFDPQYATRHDTGPGKVLLERVFRELSINTAQIRPEETPIDIPVLNYVFHVELNDETALARLFAQSQSGTPLIGHIASLFRAIAARVGVRYQIELE